MTFREELRIQRWDDHRYYHQSRINQSLHLVSAMSFLAAYVLLPTNPVAAAILGWIVAMCSRQIGHFVFEPKAYDDVNQATHEHKEDIKVGYNLRRKVVLLSIWGLSPIALYLDRSLFGLMTPRPGWEGYVYNLSVAWLWLAAGGILFRVIQLFFIQDVRTGLVWVTKILTDPFHDIKMYYKSPFYLMRGELFDPILPTTDDGEEVVAEA